MTYSSARFASRDDSARSRRSCARSTLSRPARSQARPAPARNRLRLGNARDRSGEARRAVVGLTLSSEQKAWAERKIAEAGLADRIEIRLQDYRETAEQFDAIASVEMVEAVGQRWWGAYLDSIARNLKAGRPRRVAVHQHRARAVRPLRAQRRLHPDLHFPRRMLIDEPQFEALRASAAFSGRIAKASASTMPRP